MICALCERDTDCPYDTPADPPFYPADGGRHCQGCEDWLQHGPDDTEGPHAR